MVTHPVTSAVARENSTRWCTIELAKSPKTIEPLISHTVRTEHICYGRADVGSTEVFQQSIGERINGVLRRNSEREGT